MTTYANFDDVYNNAATSTIVSISDGTPQPPAHHGSRVFQEWRGNNFSGTLVSKSAGPPRTMVVTLDTYAVNVTITEPSGRAADKTSDAEDKMVLSRNTAVISCASNGGAKPGEYPITISGKRYKGSVDVTNSSTWTCTTSDSYSISNSLISLNLVPNISSVHYITSTYGGVSLSQPVYLVKAVDSSDPNVYAGNSTQSGTGTNVTFSDTSTYSTVIWTTPTPVTSFTGALMTASATVQFQVDSSSTDRDGVGYIFGKWQYRQHGTTPWSDFGGEIRCESPCQYNTTTNTGSYGLLTTWGYIGQAAGTTWDFQLLLRIDTATSTMNGPFIVENYSVVAKS